MNTVGRNLLTTLHVPTTHAIFLLISLLKYMIKLSLNKIKTKTKDIGSPWIKNSIKNYFMKFLKMRSKEGLKT